MSPYKQPSPIDDYSFRPGSKVRLIKDVRNRMDIVPEGTITTIISVFDGYEYKIARLKYPGVPVFIDHFSASEEECVVIK